MEVVGCWMLGVGKSRPSPKPLFVSPFSNPSKLDSKTLETKKPPNGGFYLSGWQDSNLRPPAPKAGAMTGLRYTPKRNAKLLQYFLILKRKCNKNQKSKASILRIKTAQKL